MVPPTSQPSLPFPQICLFLHHFLPSLPKEKREIEGSQEEKEEDQKPSNSKRGGGEQHRSLRKKKKVTKFCRGVRSEKEEIASARRGRKVIKHIVCFPGGMNSRKRGLQRRAREGRRGEEVMMREMVGTRPEEFSSVISLRKERTIILLGGGGEGEEVKRRGRRERVVEGLMVPGGEKVSILFLVGKVEFSQELGRVVLRKTGDSGIVLWKGSGVWGIVGVVGGGGGRKKEISLFQEGVGVGGGRGGRETKPGEFENRFSPILGLIEDPKRGEVGVVVGVEKKVRRSLLWEKTRGVRSSLVLSLLAICEDLIFLHSQGLEYGDTILPNLVIRGEVGGGRVPGLGDFGLSVSGLLRGSWGNPPSPPQTQTPPGESSERFPKDIESFGNAIFSILYWDPDNPNQKPNEYVLREKVDVDARDLDVVELIQSCLQPETSRRPRIEEIHSILLKILSRKRREEEEEGEDGNHLLLLEETRQSIDKLTPRT